MPRGEGRDGVARNCDSLILVATKISCFLIFFRTYYVTSFGDPNVFWSVRK